MIEETTETTVNEGAEVETTQKPEEVSQEERALREKIEDQNKKLKEKVTVFVDELFTSDFLVGVLEHSTHEILKSYLRMKVSASKEWKVFMDAKQKSDEEFYTLSGSQLTYEETSTETKVESDTESV